jgi:hypothetical protein
LSPWGATASRRSICTGLPGVTASFTTTIISISTPTAVFTKPARSSPSLKAIRGSAIPALSLSLSAAPAARCPITAGFGKFPPTPRQIDAAGKLVAKLAQGLNIPIDQRNILTHCEAALIDGYGPYSGDAETRWDLWYLRDSHGDGAMKPGGQVIRGKALWYAKSSPLV